MRILCLSNLYPNPVDPIRGFFVRSQVLKLVEMKHLVKVISPIPITPPLFSWLVRRWRYLPSINKHYAGEPEVFHPRYLLMPRNMLFEYSGLFYYLSIRKLVKELHGSISFDLIHAHTALPDGYAAMLLSKDLGSPFLVTIHGRDLQDTIFMNKRCREAVMRVLQSAGTVINVSSKLAEECRLLLGDKPKIKIIGNGIDPGALSAVNYELTKKYAGKKIILSVGSLRKSKGHNFSLRALKELTNRGYQARLILIGGGEERKNLVNLSNDLGLGDDVEFLPPQPHCRVMEYMATCDMFVLPSWQEGFGIVYLEAMAHGKPVIGVRGQGISDVIISGVNGLLVEPESVESLTSAVQSLLEDEKYARKLGEEARSTVLRGQTWNSVAGRLDEVYRDLLAGGVDNVSKGLNPGAAY